MGATKEAWHCSQEGGEQVGQSPQEGHHLMMRKAALLLACIGALFALLSVTAPANAEEVQVPVVSTQAPASVQANETDWKMGGLPNHYTICVANGYGPTAGVITNWNWQGRKLDVRLQNRCDGYSITNRMTIDNLYQTGAACLTITNTHKTWSPGQGKYIWDANPVVWINTASPCFSNNIELYHRIQMYVGYVLGLFTDSSQCLCVMGSSDYDINNIPYVTNGDSVDMAGVYG
jgi:hypothetical protein